MNKKPQELTLTIAQGTNIMADDAALATAAKEEAAAFDALYRRYVSRVYRYCLLRCGNAQDAEDLTAQTFLAALEGLSLYRERGTFGAWLFTIARRKCHDFHRRRYRHPQEPLAAAGAAAVIIFAVFAAGLFSEPPVEPAVTEMQTPLPPIVMQGQAGMFFGVEFRLYEPLPTESAALPLYRAEAGPLPETADGVRDLALGLGMDEPVLYRTGGGWLAEDSAGRKLTIDPTSVRFPIIYRAPAGAPALATTPSWPDKATRAAAFLGGAGLLPDVYETRTRPPQSDQELMRVEIIPTLAGHPVHYASSEVVLRPDGTVAEAWIQMLTFTVTEEKIIAESGQQAFAEVLHRGATMDLTGQTPDGVARETHHPSLAEVEVGDEVRLLGFVRRLEPVDGGELRVELSQNPSGENAFLLTGPLATDLPAGQLVEVTGTLDETPADGSWRVAVTAWQAPPIDDQYLDCRSGILHRVAGDLVFLTDERLAYKLANPPAVAGGQRAEVCAVFRYTPQPLPWLSMTTPPPSGRMPAFGAMSGSLGAKVSTQVEEVEVTRVVVGEGEGDGPLPPPDDPVGVVTERVEEVDGTVHTDTATVDMGSADSPFEIGQEVEVTGIVGGFLRVEGEQVVPHIYLEVDPDDDPATAPVAYPLGGPSWGLLLEISRHYHLHVTLHATVVEAEAASGFGFQGPEGQALTLREGRWWRTWPDEKVEAFLGHFEVATLAGREVRLFVDEATGERYVDDTSLTYAQPGDSLMSNQPHAGDPVWVTGVVNPDPNATFGGLPVLTVIKQQGGPDLPDSPAEWMLDVEMPLRTSEPAPVPAAGSNTLIIDRAVLGYTYSPSGPADEGSQMLQPAWLFYGQSAGGTTHFLLRVPAVETE